LPVACGDGADFFVRSIPTIKAFYPFGRHCGPVAQPGWRGRNEAGICAI